MRLYKSKTLGIIHVVQDSYLICTPKSFRHLENVKPIIEGNRNDVTCENCMRRLK